MAETAVGRQKLFDAASSGDFAALKAQLDALCERKNTSENLAEHPDPLQIAKLYKSEKHALEIALICALFAYGNAAQIVKNLQSIDFSLLEAKESEIKRYFAGKKYRFQNSEDFAEIFISIKRLIAAGGLKSVVDSFEPVRRSPLRGEINSQAVWLIWRIIEVIYSLNDYRSQGYCFFFAQSSSTCALKRYAMWLRWMARKSPPDLGLLDFSPAELLLPLDTHTFKMSRALGFCEQKSANLRFALRATAALRRLDAADPLRYDFALYRLSQQGF